MYKTRTFGLRTTVSAKHLSYTAIRHSIILSAGRRRVSKTYVIFHNAAKTRGGVPTTRAFHRTTLLLSFRRFPKVFRSRVPGGGSPLARTNTMCYNSRCDVRNNNRPLFPAVDVKIYEHTIRRHTDNIRRLYCKIRVCTLKRNTYIHARWYLYLTVVTSCPYDTHYTLRMDRIIQYTIQLTRIPREYYFNV